MKLHAKDKGVKAKRKVPPKVEDLHRANTHLQSYNYTVYHKNVVLPYLEVASTILLPCFEEKTCKNIHFLFDISIYRDSNPCSSKHFA